MAVPTTVFGRISQWVQGYDRRDEREFLPAALEVIDTPPSPTGRALGLIIVAFFVVALAWAFFGKVDVIATAPGHLLPAGDVKIIQPLNPGVVRAIDVQDGDHVRAGQLLIELDPTETGADQDRYDRDLMQAKLDVARLTALKQLSLTGRPSQLAPPPGSRPEQIEEAEAGLRAQADQQASKVGDLTQQISQKDAELAEVSAQLDKIKATIPLLSEKERIHHDLTQQGYGTSLAYLDAQEQASEARHDLIVQTQKAAEARAARSALERQRDGARSQFQADTLSDLRKAEEQQNELSQELIKAQSKSTQTELRAPIDGVVDQLAVHSLHGVVTPAQHLMIVVPDSGNLLVEARLSNRDVGFVHAGQAVKVKVETFTFTRYGLLDGRVIDVSRDVINQRERQSGGDPTIPPPTQAADVPSYVARIALSRDSMMVDGERRTLQPGMTVTAEIRTGSRTIIDYLLSPLSRKTQESLHER